MNDNNKKFRGNIQLRIFFKAYGVDEDDAIDTLLFNLKDIQGRIFFDYDVEDITIYEEDFEDIPLRTE